MAEHFADGILERCHRNDQRDARRWVFGLKLPDQLDKPLVFIAKITKTEHFSWRMEQFEKEYGQYGLSGTCPSFDDGLFSVAVEQGTDNHFQPLALLKTECFVGR